MFAKIFMLFITLFNFISAILSIDGSLHGAPQFFGSGFCAGCLVVIFLLEDEEDKTREVKDAPTTSTP